MKKFVIALILVGFFAVIVMSANASNDAQIVFDPKTTKNFAAQMVNLSYGEAGYIQLQVNRPNLIAPETINVRIYKDGELVSSVAYIPVNTCKCE